MIHIPISGKGRISINCPTGDAAANKRQAWLSAILLDLRKPNRVWIQVYAQGSSGGTGDWRWDEKQLTARDDNLLPRACQEIPSNTTHLIVSWDVSAVPEGGCLGLETKPRV